VLRTLSALMRSAVTSIGRLPSFPHGFAARSWAAAPPASAATSDRAAKIR